MVICHYGEASERNESEFRTDVAMLVSQIELYDQIWYVRHMAQAVGKHISDAVELIKEFVSRLEEIPDGCSEIFPFDLIDELKSEYLSAK